MNSTPNVKAIRKRLGWRQHEMAAYLGIDRTSVLKIEKHGREISGPVRRLLTLLLEEEAAGRVVSLPSGESRFHTDRGTAAISAGSESCAS